MATFAVAGVSSQAIGQSALPRKGGALTIGVVSDPVTLDPAFFSSFFEIYAQYLMHEPLLSITPDLVIEPGLASYEMKDELTYVFALRPGLTFHDGSPFDAKAAKWNFERMLDPKTGSPRRSDLGPVDAVEVMGERGFSVRFKRPFAPFPHALTNRAGLFASPAAVERLGADFATRAVGAGPFRVVSWTKNAELVLERFDGYWREGMPYLDRVTLRPMPDETVRLANLRSGTVNLVDSVPPQNFRTLQRERGLKTAEKGGVGFNAFSLNLTRAPFDDKRVRQALMCALDMEAVQRAAYFNTGQPAYGAISPPLRSTFDPNFKPYTRDPSRAKALLAETGKPAPSFEITVINSPVVIRIAEIIQAQAAEAGFKVAIRQIDGTSLISVLRGKEFDLCYSPWAGRSDPDGNMFNWFTIDGPNNFMGYRNEKVDQALKEARSAAVPGARPALYREAERLIADDAPMLFVHFDAALQCGTDELHWTQHPDGSFRLFDAWLTA
ncbi:peptide/nickel transport system substrate-binding protein [Bosea sp. CRIB-10]|nr:peptide/nickel transport system substrate-binding protein [Bosea sp. CRIB-10]